MFSAIISLTDIKHSALLDSPDQTYFITHSFTALLPVSFAAFYFYSRECQESLFANMQTHLQLNKRGSNKKKEETEEWWMASGYRKRGWGRNKWEGVSVLVCANKIFHLIHCKQQWPQGDLHGLYSTISNPRAQACQ